MNPRALVQPDVLLAELRGPQPPLVVDVRWSLAGADRAGYLAGHLPGAVFCDLDTDLASPPGDGGRHPLPTAERLAEVMRRLGIGRDRDVVVLDGGAGGAAARAWWCLRWVGHERVRVLDGGLAAWAATGGPLEQGEVTPVPADDVVVRPGSMPTVGGRRRARRGRPAPCSTPGRPNGSAATSSRSTPSRATSRGRSSVPDRRAPARRRQLPGARTGRAPCCSRVSAVHRGSRGWPRR